MRRITVACAIALAALTAVTAAGCVKVELPEPQQDTVSDRITRDGATKLAASIDMAAGRLTVRGGTADVMEATYEFSDEGWRPEVDYRVEAGEGTLSVARHRTTCQLRSMPGPGRSPSGSRPMWACGSSATRTASAPTAPMDSPRMATLS